MSLKGFYKTDVKTVTPDHLVTEAAQMMRDFRVGDVVVVQNNGDKRVPVGLLTDRDITIGCVAESLDRLAEISVEEVMTKNPVCAREDEELYDIAQKMRHNGVGRMPVVDAQGMLIGIITAKNILAIISDELTEIVEISDTHREAGQAKQRPKGAQPSGRKDTQQPSSLQ